ncbi:MAG: PilZ domain-containing protein, partial [Elusimicrobia bacterium]|nr:PilZ domain-containing protein [Elusimicrobiota bacterium]
MERRKSHRASIILQARYAANNPTPAGGGKAVTRDLSQNGAALVLEHRLVPKTVVEVELELPSLERPIKTKGEVMWQRDVSGGIAPTFLTGVQFLRMESSVQEQIEHFVTSQLKRHSQTVDEKAVDSFDREIRAVQQPWPIQMATLRTTHARVAATGVCLPSTTLTNEDLVKQRGEGLLPILLQRALGAVERRAISPGNTAADIMAQAGKSILEKAGCDPKDLDRIIVSVDPADAVAPSTAVGVQAKLGATCPAYDVTMSCAGWICGIDQGLRALASGEHRILVIAGSTVGSNLPFRDLKHRAIFGDGAGGLLLESSQTGELLATALWA